MTAFETAPGQSDEIGPGPGQAAAVRRAGQSRLREHARPPSEPEPGLRRRLVPPMPGSAAWGWIGPLLVTLFGGILRFDGLSVPRAVVFDETYYVGDAWAILQHGVEINHVKHANQLLVHGSTHILAGTQAELVAHPPLGKIMMVVGEWLFGLTPFGWRFTVALIGTLSILMLARIVRRMTRSTLLGCIAGLLMALDGLELVLSRTAILDIFVMFWVLAAFGLIVIDRDRTRARLATAAQAAYDTGGGREAGRGGPAATAAQAAYDTAAQAAYDTAAQAAYDTGGGAGDGPAALAGGGPRLGIRWALIGAGLCLGAAVACKWNGVWFIAGLAALVIAWDLGARRAAGYAGRLAGVVRSDGPWLPVWFVLIPAAVYTASWTGWFATPYGYDRNGAAFSPSHKPTGTLTAWLEYNHWMLQFGLGLSSAQTYKSNPLGWLLLVRPISFYSVCTKPCGGTGSTEQEVLAIGTPLIWWGAIAALAFCIVWWLMRRDWRAGAILLPIAAGWLPWIWFYLHDQRTEFYYYAIAFEPFLIIAITLCLGLIIGPQRASPARRALGSAAAGVYLLAVLLNLAYLYPVLAARVIPYSSWLSRMWFHSWI